MQIWLKGISTPEDVEYAIAAGVDGVLISNHGGRQLNGVPATLDALWQCAPIAKGHIRIAVDGGIRRGSNMFEAIALGADFCSSATCRSRLVAFYMSVSTCSAPSQVMCTSLGRPPTLVCWHSFDRSHVTFRCDRLAWANNERMSGWLKGPRI
jgi:hypothetical protein